MDLQRWLSTLTRELGLEGAALDEKAAGVLLDLARDCAHEVERVSAPLSCYLVGVAVGRGTPLPDAVRTATGLLLEPGAPDAG